MRIPTIQQHIHLSALIAVIGLASLMFFSGTTHAQTFNQEINYQGKLASTTGAAVGDGSYNMAFALYDAASGGTQVWVSTTTVPVTDGLFSYMLGSDDTLASVDFNQTLYLGVNVGGIGTPSWDGEMTPRKILGAVPAAFEAGVLDGIDSSSFLRGDQDDTASGLLTFTGGFISSASSTITNLTTTIATTTTMSLSSSSLTTSFLWDKQSVPW